MARRRPLWRWEPGLLIAIVLLTTVASILQKLATPVVASAVLAVGIVLLVGLVVLYVLAVVRRAPVRPADGVLRDVSTVRLRAIPTSDTVQIERTERTQDRIDAVHARLGSNVTAVLTPNATTWFGRELRTAVDLLVGTQTRRVGFLPPLVDARIGARLDELARLGEYASVPASIIGTRRPFRVVVGFVELDALE